MGRGGGGRGEEIEEGEEEVEDMTKLESGLFILISFILANFTKEIPLK